MSSRQPPAPPSPDWVVDTQPCPLPRSESGVDVELPGDGEAPAGFLVADAPSMDRSGFVDTAPGPLAPMRHFWPHRALLACADPVERMHWRARMALRHLVWVDDAVSTTQALIALGSQPYEFLVVSATSTDIDPAVVADAFLSSHPAGTLVLTVADEPVLQRTGWLWRRKPLVHDLTWAHTGQHVHRLSVPLVPPEMESVLQEWCERHGR